MSLVNSAEALSRFDDDSEIYLDLIDTFLDSGMADFDAMRDELREGSVKQVAFRAHKIKGASLTLGAEELAGISGGIEASLRERYYPEITAGTKVASFNPLEYEGQIDLLDRIYGETVAELARLRETLQTR